MGDTRETKLVPVRWGALGTVLWSFLITIVFLISQVLIFRFFTEYRYGSISSIEHDRLRSEILYNGDLLIFSLITSTAICIPLILLVIKLKQGTNIKEYLGIKMVQLPVLKRWLIIIVTLVFINDSITLLIGKPIVPEFMTIALGSTTSIFGMCLALTVFAPLFEELLFRGFLFSGISSTKIGHIGAIIITSISWATIHLQYDLYWIFSIFIFGMVLGVARYKSGSVILVFGLHAFNNLISFIEALIVINPNA
ncbi:MAG: CPBP family intramembrane metalloprotease [FCB group bacterium]|nr:CPBP family intramembrane metalloprotease [FCB group bacterium]